MATAEIQIRIAEPNNRFNHAAPIRFAREFLVPCNATALTAAVVRKTLATLKPAIVEGSSIQLDCTRVVSIDSEAIGALLGFWNDCAEEGSTFGLCGVGPKLHALLKLVRLSEVLEIASQEDPRNLEEDEGSAVVEEMAVVV
jgi:anti-anti-sigma factor